MKRFYIIYLLGSLSLFAGCTLSMEEWEISEEDRGKDEIYTEETEYGDISYQFSDSVLYVTDNIQEQYLVRVERDSILYFSDLLPDEWRPYVGMKMAAGISHMLPYGLNHRVISVQNVGGFYKVVTTKTSIEDVYKHLSYCIDMDVAAPDLGGMDSTELADYGYQMHIDPVTGDTTIIDWNDYDIAQGERPAYARRKSLIRTRAEKEMDEKKADESGVETTTWFDVMLDTRDVSKIKEGAGFAAKAWHGINTAFLDKVKAASAKAAKKKIDWDFYAGFGMKLTSFTHVHAERDEEKNYECDYTDTWTEFDFRAEVGFEAKNNSNYDKQPNLAYYDNVNFGIPAREFIDGMKDAMKGKAIPSTLSDAKKSWNNLKVRIILPLACPVTVAIILEGSITPQVVLNGCLCAKFKYTSDKVRSGQEIRNGEPKKYEDEVIEEGKFENDGLVGKGSFKVGASFRAAVGFEVASSVGLTVGANMDVFLEGNISADIGKMIVDQQEEHNVINNIKGDVRFYCDIYGDIRIFVAPLGISLWEKQTNKFLVKNLFNYAYSVSPSVIAKNAEGRFQFGNVADTEIPDQFGYVDQWICYRNLDGINSFFSKGLRYAGAKCYFGPIKDNKWILMTPVDNNYDPYSNVGKYGLASAGPTYRFRSFVDLAKYADKPNEPIQELHVVPVFYSYKSDYNPTFSANNFEQSLKYIDYDNIIELTSEDIIVDTGKPLITTLHAGHIESMDIDEMVDKGQYIGWNGNSDGNKNGINQIEKGKSKALRLYTFYTTVKVQGGSLMDGWGLTVYILSPKKKTLLKQVIPVNKLRTGTYSFLFSFYSDWAPQSMVANPEDEEDLQTDESKLYFQVTPYWNVSAGNEMMTVPAADKKSLRKFPITYFKDDDSNMWTKITKNPGTYGESDNINLTQ